MESLTPGGVCDSDHASAIFLALDRYHVYVTVKSDKRTEVEGWWISAAVEKDRSHQVHYQGADGHE